MKLRHIILALVLFSIVGTGCRILRPNVMLQTKRNYPFDEITKLDTAKSQYVINPNDMVQIRMFSNEGFRLLDVGQSQSGGNQNLQRNFAPAYIVEHDSVINLPIIGRTKIAGMTVREAEFFLEDLFSQYYVKPYIMLDVTSRKVVVFPGAAGQARIIPLGTEQTTLLQVLAQTGGISANGKAYNIKLIRGNAENPEVYSIDLSTIEGLKYANMVVYSNDIIYVEPRVFWISEILSEVSPVIQLLSTTISLITTWLLFKSLTNQ